MAEGGVSREVLSERHAMYVAEMKNMILRIPLCTRDRMTDDFISALATSLLDMTVFEILKNLTDIQGLTEVNLLERRLKLVRAHEATCKKVINRHKEALTKVHPLEYRALKVKQANEYEEITDWQAKEISEFDMKVIMELDQTVSDQQITLERVGVPGFFVTNKPTDVKLQMTILRMIKALSAKFAPA